MDKFYSPAASDQAGCNDCHDCVNACPAKAVEPGSRGLVFDRRKCAEYALKQGECLECITVCPAGALTMKAFFIDEKGEIVQAA